MADFLPPFADAGERRLPTSIEQSNGIPCGPLDRTLFNGIFNLHNGNIGRVIQEAGVTGPDGDLTKLFRAIQALIESATGTSSGGDTSQFVLFSQARARLPIFPDVLNTDGRIVCTSPGTGQVRVPGGVDFLHRGIWLVTTTQTDIATDPSKTYHLRWNPTDGIVLRDLASGTYNPGTLQEFDAAFDSTFDDMLIARVVTNSSNVPTITNLSNKAQLNDIQVLDGTRITPPSGDGTRYTFSTTLNWSRTPKFLHSVRRIADPNSGGVRRDEDVETLSVNRYGMSAQMLMDYSTTYRINALFLAN